MKLIAVGVTATALLVVSSGTAGHAAVGAGGTGPCVELAAHGGHNYGSEAGSRACLRPPRLSLLGGEIPPHGQAAVHRAYVYDVPVVARGESDGVQPVEGGLSTALGNDDTARLPAVAASHAATTPAVLTCTPSAALRLGGHSVDDLAAAAGRAGPGDLTVAGHSLTKHGAGARPGNAGLFPAARGNPAQINAVARAQVDDILSSGPRSVQGYRGRFGDTIEVIAPDGRGIVYDSSGNFLFFAEFPP